MNKTIFDFMKNKLEYEWYDGSFKIINHGNGTLSVIINEVSYPFETQYELQDIVEEKLGKEIRFCDYCGCPMDRGFTDDYADFYNCEECFSKDMDERYGKGKWRAQSKEDYGDDCNYMGGFYEYLDKETREWEPEPSYYTEWF